MLAGVIIILEIVLGVLEINKRIGGAAAKWMPL